MQVIQGTHNYDNYHCVLRRLNIYTSMACDCIDLRYTKLDKNVEYLS